MPGLSVGYDQAHGLELDEVTVHARMGDTNRRGEINRRHWSRREAAQDLRADLVAYYLDHELNPLWHTGGRDKSRHALIVPEKFT